MYFNYRTNIALCCNTTESTWCGLILLYLPYKEYHTGHGKRHLPYKEMSKIRLFHVNKMAVYILHRHYAVHVCSKNSMHFKTKVARQCVISCRHAGHILNQVRVFVFWRY